MPGGAEHQGPLHSSNRMFRGSWLSDAPMLLIGAPAGIGAFDVGFAGSRAASWTKNGVWHGSLSR
jgi:hypothetical protein